VHAARMAPLEELLAELREEGAPRAAAVARATAPAPGSAAREMGFAPATPAGPAAPVAKAESTQLAATPPAGRAASMPPPSLIAAAAKAQEFSGLAAAQVEAIKSAIQAQHKFLSSLVEPVVRWELEGGEVRLYFPTESRALAEMLQSRDPLEKLRAITSQVLGQSLRVCVKLESARGTAPRAPSAALNELRAQFEQDPIVREMLARFGGQILDVKRRREED